MRKFFINPTSNMLKLCFSKNFQKSKLHDLIYGWGQGVSRVYQNEKNLKSISFQVATFTILGQ